jgi:hypothetical protein
VREQQLARLEHKRAQSAENLQSLKTRVASLLKGRAEDEDRRARTAQREVAKVSHACCPVLARAEVRDAGARGRLG